MPQQPAIGEDVSALMPAVGADVSHLMDAAPAQPSGGVEGFAREFWQRANPLAWAGGLVEAAKHPGDAVLGLIKADPAFLTQAHDAAGKGEHLKAVRKVLAYLSMGFGHELDNQAELIASGRHAEAAGAMTGMATQLLAPEAAVKGLAALPRGVSGMAPANPSIANAVAAGKAAGVPMSAATATDNLAVRAVQHISDRTIGGAGVAGRAAQAEARGLATMGEQLAAKGHPVAVSAESAGQGVQDAVLGQVRGHAGDANAAYDALRKIEADPKHARVIEPGPVVPRENARSSFIYGDGTPDEIFQGAWRDAKESGYKGSIGELRTEFADKLRQAKSLKAESVGTAGDYGPAELLKSIRDLGGLKPYIKDITQGAPGAKLGEEFQNVAHYFGGKGASSVFRDGGLGLDDMVSQLRQDPRWASMLTEDSDLLAVLDEIGRDAKHGVTHAPPTDLQHYLRGVGVEPGVPWWEAPKQAVEMALPVDLRPAQQALGPIHADLLRQSKLTPFVSGSGKARALDALDRLVSADGHAPLSTVDGALSELKAFARSGAAGDVPEMATQGQGAAKLAIAHLEHAVQQTAAGAGPEAVAALDAGRQATIAKYGAADVLDALRAEPVKVHGQLTAPKDGAVAQLRTVAQQAPAELPKIGRAVLDGLLEKAQAGGGFARADGVFNDWHALGPETKRLLYRDPGYIKELDNFFLLAKQSAKNANPSGSAHAVAVAAQGGELLKALWTLDPHALAYAGASVAAGAGLSTFLHSTAGVRLLSEGLRLPRTSATAQAMWIAKAKQFGAATGSVLASQPPTASPAR